MLDETNIHEKLGALQQAAPAGYALAFHIAYTTPTYLFQTYPAAWIKYYSENGLVMSDPTVHWGFENEGTIRWSDLAALDSAGVMSRAAEHGMRFGLTCSIDENESKSFASFSHNSREFTDAEAQDLLRAVSDLHRELANLDELSKETAAALKKMSVQVTRPGS